MSRLSPFILAIAAICGAAGAPAQSTSSVSTQADGAAARVAQVDREFVHSAAQAGQAKIQASRLALAKSTDAQVRGFAQQLLDEHTQANAQLRRIAQAKGMDVPVDASLAHKIKLQLLDFADGAEFDKRYADDFGVEAHRETIELFQQEIAQGRDPEVKAFARDVLPQLEAQMRTAQELKAGVQPDR
jgi:putative membrane protein